MSALPPMLTPLSSEFLDFSLAHSPGHFHAFFSVYLWDFYFILALLYRRFSLKVAYAFWWLCLVKFHLWLTCFQSCSVCYSKLLFFWVPGVQAIRSLYQPPRVFRPVPKPNLAQGLGYLHMAALRLTFTNSPGKKKKTTKKPHSIFLLHLHATLEGTLAVLASVCGTIQAALHH